jgi:hypothetical protein
LLKNELYSIILNKVLEFNCILYYYYYYYYFTFMLLIRKFKINKKYFFYEIFGTQLTYILSNLV